MAGFAVAVIVGVPVPGVVGVPVPGVVGVPVPGVVALFMMLITWSILVVVLNCCTTLFICCCSSGLTTRVSASFASDAHTTPIAAGSLSCLSSFPITIIHA